MVTRYTLLILFRKNTEVDIRMAIVIHSSMSNIACIISNALLRMPITSVINRSSISRMKLQVMPVKKR